MSVIYLQHPVHGRKVACSEQEAKYDETKGWSRFDPGALMRAPVAAAEPDLRAQYIAKFGKPPHYKKSPDKIRAELGA